MQNNKKQFNQEKLIEILKQEPDIIAVYLFGSYLDEKVTQPGDVDLALLLSKPPKSNVQRFIKLYPKLSEVFAPFEVDLLFLHSVKVPMRFEVISASKVIYCTDDDLRTDFEDNVTREYLDFMYHLKAAHREFYEELMEGNLFV
ncbi:type VII toxin-antitoxin system MntA family adenylyltransferase antitoxin [Desulfoscipio geothermicus]|jgi:predicted nucleotidyltransferase|uniref:Predicted nucleotidyltransferase n=1 Tax=Desulfoscipio geothermicus DSM 3669 TaxID=1121426 RepID=A0A1I6D727_9FIRM|nr:nucleotidyltransferase domain-containing protein [Desulfoscipio geothermicus]SFR01249.1 Predicted nucleotidyltransferase [Desulfoscipio geothermicus DSM 3669]